MHKKKQNKSSNGKKWVKRKYKKWYYRHTEEPCIYIPKNSSSSNKN